jgi:cyclopropane fatty-acyl-phospholipid synthase-like methyltransferase
MCIWILWRDLKKKINTEYTGIDISKEAVKYGKRCSGLNLIAEDYLSFQKPDNPYSDVFLWDVIEHLKSPDKYLEKISREMHRNGRLYITTGDIDSFIAKSQKEKWRLIHPPTHLHYFSKNTIKIFLNNYKFDIKKINYPAINRSIKQILYSLFILDRKRNNFIRLMPSSFSIPINTFDIMFIIAEKN